MFLRCSQEQQIVLRGHETLRSADTVVNLGNKQLQVSLEKKTETDQVLIFGKKKLKLIRFSRFLFLKEYISYKIC